MTSSIRLSDDGKLYVIIISWHFVHTNVTATKAVIIGQ